jgi:hypothetical protein
VLPALRQAPLLCSASMEHPVPVDAYRHALRQLLLGWRIAERKAVSVDGKDIDTVKLIYPWVTQTHRFGKAFLSLETVGLEHEAHPIVRAALEYTLMAHWVALTGDSAVVARYAEDQRQLRAMVKDVAGSRRDVAPSTWNLEILRGWVAAGGQAGVDEDKFNASVGNVCDSLGVKNSLYAAYRLHCWFTHPTTHSAGIYLEDLGGEKFALRVEPSIRSTSGLVAMMAHCVFWSRRVLDDLAPGHPVREWLDEIGASIQVLQRLPARQA